MYDDVSNKIDKKISTKQVAASDIIIDYWCLTIFVAILSSVRAVKDWLFFRRVQAVIATDDVDVT